jgi:hypothetical protein
VLNSGGGHALMPAAKLDALGRESLTQKAVLGDVSTPTRADAFKLTLESTMLRHEKSDFCAPVYDLASEPSRCHQSAVELVRA